MKIDCRTIWQQAAGDKNRDYVDVCIRFDVILNGPGRHGRWPECSTAQKLKGKIGKRKLTDLRRFSESIKDGDLVVLRLGTSEVHAVGQVVGDYLYHPEFGDVDGWDLEHVRRVRWLWTAPSKQIDERIQFTVRQPQIFEPYSMKLGDTTQPLNDGRVKEWLARLPIPEGVQARPLAELPVTSAEELSLEELAAFMSENTLTNLPTAPVRQQLQTLNELANWYRQTDEDPTEHEAVAHLALPLLTLLGWSTRQLAIEWKSMDIALFEKLPRHTDHLAAIVEAKRLGRSCLGALHQAIRYAKKRPSCQRLILTDGPRYWVHVKQGAAWTLHAHLNLRRLRSENPIYRCAGAKEALLAMAPGWKGLDVSG
jgi:hypothetical protein